MWQISIRFYNSVVLNNLNQGGLNKKGVQLDLYTIFSIFIFIELYLFA